MRSRIGKLWIDEMGTAFAEALVSLPVLIALLGGTVALSSMYRAKLEAMARARRLAWLQADSGQCPARSCASPACQAAESQIDSEALGRLRGVSEDGMSLHSFVAQARDYFVGSYTSGVASAEARLPSTSRSAITVQRGATRILCNTTPKSTEEARSVLEQACASGLETTEYAREVCR
ncbi:MAG: hypothetical protein PVI24_16730 [Myxococcales bacterium]|jgi:hypothetical protein